MLLGKFPLYRILLDVSNRSADIVGVFEEDLPTWTTPYRMIVGPSFGIAKPQAADGLEILDHILRLLAVLANQEVNVIRHNRASIASVGLLANTLSERTSDYIHVLARDLQDRELQHLLRSFAKILDHPTCRLYPFAAIMQLPKFRNNVRCDVLGHASPRIVGKPESIGGPSEMNGGAPTVLASFNGNNGFLPDGNSTINASTIYGTTGYGGSLFGANGGDGVVFSFCCGSP
jgi:hypothetical protein